MEFCLVPSLPLPHHKLLHGILHTADIKQQICVPKLWDGIGRCRSTSISRLPVAMLAKIFVECLEVGKALDNSILTLPQVTRNYHDQQDSTYPYLHSLAKRRSRISATVDRLAAGYAYIVGPGGPVERPKGERPRRHQSDRDYQSRLTGVSERQDHKGP